MRFRLRTLMIVLALLPPLAPAVVKCLQFAKFVVFGIHCPKLTNSQWDVDTDWDGGPPDAIWIDPEGAGPDNRP
jgi:hypothetical protein